MCVRAYTCTYVYMHVCVYLLPSVRVMCPHANYCFCFTRPHAQRMLQHAAVTPYSMASMYRLGAVHLIVEPRQLVAQPRRPPARFTSFTRQWAL